jgi:hypothetical protein
MPLLWNLSAACINVVVSPPNGLELICDGSQLAYIFDEFALSLTQILNTTV